MNQNKLILITGGLFAGFALVLIILLIFSDKEAPGIALQLPEKITSGQPLDVVFTDSGAGLGKLDVFAELDDASTPEVVILKSAGDKHQKLLRFTVANKAASEGKLTIRASAADKSFNNLFAGNKTTYTAITYLDDVPPSASFQQNEKIQTLPKGDTVLLRFSPSEEIAEARLFSGLLEFPVFPLEGGDFAAFATLPFDADSELFKLTLRLTDMVGNSAEIAAPVKKLDRQFRNDDIFITDAFLEAKADELSKAFGVSSDPLTLYLLMNGGERSKNYAKIKELCSNTQPVKLWEGAFLPQPGAIRRGEFADQRNYFYNNVLIDAQVHQGLDYASIANDYVPASGGGVVVFAEYLGIHGKMVLIDHGLGLHSLYSHLSEILVQDRQEVKKGDLIGRTGKTGLAGGDHLHFEILLNGISVNPLPWFDEVWVKDIENRLSQ